MTINCLHYTPLAVCSTAIRKCYKSGKYSDTTNITDPTGPKDKALIDRIGNKMRHESVKNHINYTFEVDAVSTKTLLAVTRHDEGTEFSVESTRFTLSKRKNELSYTKTNDPVVDKYLDDIMQMVANAIDNGSANDDVAMLLPQAYNYSFVTTFSLTALQHFLALRLKKEAHWDIRELANKMYEVIPAEHKYLFEDYIDA